MSKMKNIRDVVGCTGCSACVVFCHADAIRMEIGRNGFLYPKVDQRKCINCGKCFRLCPLNGKHDIPEKKAFMAQSRDAKQRMDSASGAIFAELAKFVLDNHGVVYGCVFSGSIEAVHFRGESLHDLKRIVSSKYVQSKIGDTYRQVLSDLNNDRKVLFSGTPCQIAGLKAVLGNNAHAKNLLTVEIVCHGVPSPTMFERFKQEIEVKYGSKLADICFRYKPLGWKNQMIYLKFANGESAIEDPRVLGYMQIFRKYKQLRPSCGDCHYKNGKSGADITIGDFWGCELTPYNIDDGRGTSCVVVNTSVGALALESVSGKLEIVQSCVKDVSNGNFAYQNSKNDAGVKRFLLTCSWRCLGIERSWRMLEKIKSMRSCSVYKRVNDHTRKFLLSFSKARRIGIMTVGTHYLLMNYGAFFQHYALRSFLSKNGFTPFRITDVLPSSEYSRLMRPFLSFAKRILLHRSIDFLGVKNSFLRFRFLLDYRSLIGPLCEWQGRDSVYAEIMGGDQAWHPCLGIEDGFLKREPRSTPKLSYATSTNWTLVKDDAKWQHDFISSAAEYKGIGVREKSGIDWLSTLAQHENYFHTIDPTLLLDARHYCGLVRSSRMFQADTLLCYVVGEHADNTAENNGLPAFLETSRRLGIDVKMFGIETAALCIDDKYLLTLTPRGFLKAYRDCKYVITNSFHGIVFALIFNKNFVFIPQREKKIGDPNYRQRELLQILGLSKREVPRDAEGGNIAVKLIEPIQWEIVLKKIDVWRNASAVWLLHTLGQCNKNAKNEKLVS